MLLGGVTHTERDFQSVLIEIDGTVSGGDKIVMIHWKKRTCAVPKTNTADLTKGNSRTGTVATVKPPQK
jgi:hypothetical protein